MRPSLQLRSSLRKFLLLIAALLCGWWARGVHIMPVMAQDGDGSANRSAGENGLAFQLSGIGPDTALTVWNASNRTLYVYQGAVMGHSNVNCTYSFKIERPGAPIQRQNCPVGSLFPPR